MRGEQAPLDLVGLWGAESLKSHLVGGTGDIVSDGRWYVLQGEGSDGDWGVQVNVHIASAAIKGEALAGGHCRGQQLLQHKKAFPGVVHMLYSQDDFLSTLLIRATRGQRCPVETPLRSSSSR